MYSCNEKKDVLYIAAASNVQYAMDEIINSFETETGIPCELVTASSGKLTAQIQEGAPFHVFLSADMKYPMQLFNESKTLGKPVVYAQGKIVLWSANASLDMTMDLLNSENFKHIALPNPLNAPYGQAALEAIRFYGMYEKLLPKLVYGESVSQTNQFIMTGAADLGFTAKSIMMSPNLKGFGTWIEIDSRSYNAIDQGVVLIKNEGKRNKGAEIFFNFLFSKEAHKIFEKYGYEVVAVNE